MAETDIEKVIAEFMAKLKPVSEYTPEERAAAKAKWEKDEAEKAARKAKWPEIEECKGEKLLQGIAASPGLAAGIVRNVRKHVPELMANIQAGEVIVGDRLTVKHYKYVKMAAAVVTDTGGINCSIAFTARGLDLPAVTGTIEATSVLKDGQKVVVDGSEGVVYAYKEKTAPKHSEHQDN